jgi:hypothetical protein
MKPGSVIVDLAASTGGNCTLTKPNEIYTTENGVTIVGKVNQLPAQASQLYGNNLCHLLDDMGKAENFNINMEDDVVKRAMVTYNGAINWPPEPLPVSPTKPKVEKEVVLFDKAEQAKQKACWPSYFWTWASSTNRFFKSFYSFYTGGICGMANYLECNSFITHATHGSYQCH